MFSKRNIPMSHFATFVILLIALAVCGCESSKKSRAELHKQYTGEFIEILRNNTRILKRIHDAETAKASLAELQESMAKMNRLTEQIKQLGDIPKEEHALLTTSLGREMLDAMEEFTAEMKRLQSIPEAFEITQQGLENQPVQ